MNFGRDLGVEVVSPALCKSAPPHCSIILTPRQELIVAGEGVHIMDTLLCLDTFVVFEMTDQVISQDLS